MRSSLLERHDGVNAPQSNRAPEKPSRDQIWSTKRAVKVRWMLACTLGVDPPVIQANVDVANNLVILPDTMRSGEGAHYPGCSGRRMGGPQGPLHVPRSNVASGAAPACHLIGPARATEETSQVGRRAVQIRNMTTRCQSALQTSFLRPSVLFVAPVSMRGWC